MVEQRLIDANEFERYIDCGHLRLPYELCFSENDVVNMIRKQSTVDAAPIVRCKNCKNRETCEIQWGVDDDFYCADGERNGGDKD